MEDSKEERAHWRSVVEAFKSYERYHLSANHDRRMAFLQLPKEERDVYERLGYLDKIEAVDEGIRRNAEFLQAIIADPVFADSFENDAVHLRHSHDDHAHGHGHTHDPVQGEASHSHSHDHAAPEHAGRAEKRRQQTENDAAQDKIRSVLRSFVRDWSGEGQSERSACYQPCLQALEAHHRKLEVSGKAKKDVRVLVPGCGLARLAMEVAEKGYFSQANEFSAYMLLASNFVLNQTTSTETHTIYPFLHSFSNHLTTEHHLLRRVQLPDVCPAEVLGGGNDQAGEFSLVAGDFEEIYGESASPSGETHASQKGQWGAVITCFFIDCARNPLRFLRIIYDLLEDDGVWINIGPLLWHFENSGSASVTGQRSIELSLDEIKELAHMIGLEIHDERLIETTYTGIPDGMLRHRYQAAFWTATKHK